MSDLQNLHDLVVAKKLLDHGEAERPLVRALRLADLLAKTVFAHECILLKPMPYFPECANVRLAFQTIYPQNIGFVKTVFTRKPEN